MVRINNIRIMELLEPDFFGGVLNHNLAVVERGPSGGLMLIDTGLPGYLETIEEYLKSWGFSIEDVSDVVVTHWHHDHAGNASEIRKLSGAKVYAHYLETSYLLDPPTYQISYAEVTERLKVPEEDFKRTMRRINDLKYDPVIVDVTLRGGEDLAGFKVIHVPGHTPGHIALYNGEDLVVGDAMRGIGGEPTPPLEFFSWDYELSLASFRKLSSIPAKVIVPFHGEVIQKW
ncbi:MBL fold metallo-hydrolase [Metallosphaera tengchongensis]|uniref:MBL fold metallo-hydrolase n=1 Tax=Metallosphaera tengchongensis TaxID=1532350 RepID=A0A6N0NYT6_9CREN|nr:MBL fold metallo-hydrolase [Metallosphaera tengchongensis]QKR00311.1 MBL fold metallo-hydrolase [Metallosphaera tengchongensis]